MSNKCLTQKDVKDLQWGGTGSVRNNIELCTIKYAIDNLGAARKPGEYTTNTTKYSNNYIVTQGPSSSDPIVELQRAEYLTGIVINSDSFQNRHRGTGFSAVGETRVGYLGFDTLSADLKCYKQYSTGRLESTTANWSITTDGVTKGHIYINWEGDPSTDHSYVNSESAVKFVKFSGTFTKYTITATTTIDGVTKTASFVINYDSSQGPTYLGDKEAEAAGNITLTDPVLVPDGSAYTYNVYTTVSSPIAVTVPGFSSDYDIVSFTGSVNAKITYSGSADGGINMSNTRNSKNSGTDRDLYYLEFNSITGYGSYSRSTGISSFKWTFNGTLYVSNGYYKVTASKTQ